MSRRKEAILNLLLFLEDTHMHDSLFQNHLEICIEDLKNFISYNLAGSILGFCPKENSKYCKAFVYQVIHHSIVYDGKQKQTT